MRIVNLSVQGYRSLVDVSVQLHPLNVLIGPNGSGKTSVLEVIQILKFAMMEEGLTEALQKQGGTTAVLSRVPNGPDRLKIELAVDAESDKSQEPMCYRFEVAPRGTGHVIPCEQLEWQWDPEADKPFRYIDAHYDHIRYVDPETAHRWVEPTWDHHASELALAQMPRMYKEPQDLRSTLRKTSVFSFLDVRQRAVVRLSQPLTPTTLPGPNGENLYSALYNLRAGHHDVYDRLEGFLRLGFPGFRQLEFPVVGAGQVTMTWDQEELTNPLYPTELSEGTLRFLWLATVLLSPDPSPITLIDEPEVSLHPELLKLLAELLQDAAVRGQLIVATHSSDLVRWLQPDEVLVLDKVDGRTQFAWADAMDLTEWLKEYSLSELWLMGTLGGRSL